MIKFQTLAIIFILIVLPISMLLTYYINSQIDTIAIQNSYDTKLLNATYDAIVAFQLNTINNDGYSRNADALRRDINASIKTFTTSLANNFGISGSGSNAILPYIPAVVYTLYDGYYIYSPIPNTTVDEQGNQTTTYEHTLKPYVSYTARYYRNNGQYDIVVNYSLDNYIVVYGNINGTYYSKAGYLTYLKKFEENNINLSGTIQNYYIDESNTFTTWVQENLKEIRVQDIVVEVDGENVKTAKDLQDNDTQNSYYEFKNNTEKIFEVKEENDPEVKTSTFCEHKNLIIRKSIESNLNSAINNYTKQSEGLGTTYDFKMPILSATEWDKVLSNVSIMSFMQGLDVGLKKYNNYMIVSSTGNRQLVDTESLYFITSNELEQRKEKILIDEKEEEFDVYYPTENSSTYYHRINCPLLAEELKNHPNQHIEGYANIDFKGIYNDTEDVQKYEYKHQALACYECIVSSKVGGIVYNTSDKDIGTNGRPLGRKYFDANQENNLINFITENNNGEKYEDYDPDVVNKLRTAYYKALFKERRKLIKVSSYVNNAS